MKKNNIIKCIGLIGILFCISACSKLEFHRVMDTSTDKVVISGTSVVVHGSVLDLGKSKIINHGHCWSKNATPTIADYSSNLGTIEGTGDFYSKLNNLYPGLTYYVRSYLFDGSDYAYGTTISFKITGDSIRFSSEKTSKLSNTSILVKSSTLGIGSINFSKHGHCWSLTDPPTISDSLTTISGTISSDTTFESQISNLAYGRYYIRGYLKADSDIIYSNTVIYESQISLNTDLISLGTLKSATAYGTIKSLGVNHIVNYGHCWSTYTSSPDLNYLSEHSSLGPQNRLVTYSSELTNLISGRVYYVRAYATDGINVYYGEIKNFTSN